MQRSWNRLGHWADKRLPGLLLLAFLLLMSQLDSAQASDIELAPAASDDGLALAVLGVVLAALLPALAALLYGLLRSRSARSDRPVSFPAADRQDLRIKSEYQP
jgi:hypothetical protein